MSQAAKSGVSLHCHTEHSKEMLDFVPHYAEKLPIISYFWKKERDKYQEKEGKGIDFSTAYWSPPMTPQMVYDIEKSQINQAGLDALVSISDHDSIDANLQVNEQTDNAKAPISLEWTVPFEYGFFHVGVHNLPKARAIEITKTLLDYTFGENPSNEKLHRMFAMLNEIPQVLVILNHPLWDIEIVGRERHEALLKNFIKEHGKWIHAFEINGFRTWSENKAVIEMAEALGIPIATGGDRHGCKPNTVVNLTNAKTFEEFVEEIRVDKRSEVVLMPEYSQPLHSRQLQSFSEILKLYPEFPEGRQKWFDRVYFDTGDGEGSRKLSVHWKRGGPTWLRWAIWTLGVLGSPKMRPFFAIARKKHDRVPKTLEKAKFEIPNLEEIAPSLSSDAVS
ncbi:MAG TPA: hypothetical protein VGC76_15360 [Pyrinomonadaceae bacterium]